MSIVPFLISLIPTINFQLFFFSSFLLIFADVTSTVFGWIFTAIGIILFIIKIFLFIRELIILSCQSLPNNFKQSIMELIFCFCGFLGAILAFIYSKSNQDTALRAFSIIFIIIGVTMFIVTFSLKNYQLSLPRVNPNQRSSAIIRGEGIQDCSICLQKVRYNRVMLGCSHQFHGNCFKKWKQRNCPNCRAPY